jgi:hypothetical protein
MRSALKVAAFALLFPLVASCAPEPRQPDKTTREEFAKSVMTAAASGSVEQVEKLVPDDRIDVRPGAQELVDSARGWDPASWKVGLRDYVPEYAFVTVMQEGKAATIKYEISWSNERWGLILGTSRNRPSGGAQPGTPGTGTPKVIEPTK